MQRDWQRSYPAENSFSQGRRRPIAARENPETFDPGR